MVVYIWGALRRAAGGALVLALGCVSAVDDGSVGSEQKMRTSNETCVIRTTVDDPRIDGRLISTCIVKEEPAFTCDGYEEILAEKYCRTKTKESPRPCRFQIRPSVERLWVWYEDEEDWRGISTGPHNRFSWIECGYLVRNQL